MVSACTYESTINDKHLDFNITTDTDKLSVVQYIRRSGSAFVTKMYGPNLEYPWTYLDDLCNVYVNYPIACRQNRGPGIGSGAYWQWSTNGYAPYHLLPAGTWGLDFDVPPNHESIDIMYGTTGGGDAWTYCTRTGEIAEPPTPPVTKVFFAPGLGGSWNVDALLGCYPDPNTDNWTMAPYAEDIYKPVLTVLNETGWDVNTFFYDWRNQVSNNGILLNSYINGKTEADEKINFVGHSMGGLVGRSYLETQEGGKFENYLSLGSPHKGTPLAYPAWSGGEIWNDNFLAKIATTLYLKRCGGVFSNDRETLREQIPSVQNLLPTFDYLKVLKSGQLVTPVYSTNNWLPTPFEFHGVRIGTLSGEGYETLESIQVKDPSKKEILNGDWQDGKAIGKLYSYSGDGTVLANSSTIDGAENVTINQNHSGLTSSSQGLAEVLKFLGTYDIPEIQESSEPESMLVLIGHPANFLVTGDDGTTKTSVNGMVALTNPGRGNYKINILPKSNDTLFIVAQFLPNNKTLYKEYRLGGLTPKYKNIELDPKNPKEDILI
jgi:pimeloyl-ACP methyl ester carboxylesterase